MTARDTVVKTCLELTAPIADWPSAIPLVRLVINTRWSPVTRSTPFNLMFGRRPLLTDDSQARHAGPCPEEFDTAALTSLWSAFKPYVLPLAKSFTKSFYEASDARAPRRLSPVKAGDLVFYMPPREQCDALGLS